MFILIYDFKMDPSGFEPETSALQGRRSTAELRARYFKTFMFYGIHKKIKNPNQLGAKN